jgi:hypothetical protein
MVSRVVCTRFNVISERNYSSICISVPMSQGQSALRLTLEFPAMLLARREATVILEPYQ